MIRLKFGVPSSASFCYDPARRMDGGVLAGQYSHPQKVNTMTGDDYVYVFHHIPKCGGTSMRKAFRKWFRRKRDYRPGWAEGKKLERFRRRPWRLEKIEPDTIICGHFEVDSIYLHQRYPQVLAAPR